MHPVIVRIFCTQYISPYFTIFHHISPIQIWGPVTRSPGPSSPGSCGGFHDASKTSATGTPRSDAPESQTLRATPNRETPSDNRAHIMEFADAKKVLQGFLERIWKIGRFPESQGYPQYAFEMVIFHEINQDCPMGNPDLGTWSRCRYADQQVPGTGHEHCALAMAWSDVTDVLFLLVAQKG